MNTRSVNLVASHVLRKIVNTAIDTEPFPHIIVYEIFPEDYYEQLLTIVSNAAEYVPAEYSGTGVDKDASN